MTWTREAILGALENSVGVFLAPGVMGAVAAIFKVNASMFYKKSSIL